MSGAAHIFLIMFALFLGFWTTQRSNATSICALLGPPDALTGGGDPLDKPKAALVLSKKFLISMSVKMQMFVSQPID